MTFFQWLRNCVANFIAFCFTVALTVILLVLLGHFISLFSGILGLVFAFMLFLLPVAGCGILAYMIVKAFRGK